MPTISTRYIPPTNTKCARVKAWVTNHTGGPSVTVGYHSHDKPHDVAARMLAQSLTYKGEWSECGSTEDGRGFLYVCRQTLTFSFKTGETV